MSSKTASPTSYGDVKYVLDQALALPGLTYECANHGRAVYFRQRCNTFRRLMRTMQAELIADTPGARPSTAYDILVFRLIDSEGRINAKTGHIIRCDHESLEGVLRDPEGNVITPPSSFHLIDPA